MRRDLRRGPGTQKCRDDENGECDFHRVHEMAPESGWRAAVSPLERWRAEVRRKSRVLFLRENATIL